MYYSAIDTNNRKIINLPVPEKQWIRTDVAVPRDQVSKTDHNVLWIVHLELQEVVNNGADVVMMLHCTAWEIYNQIRLEYTEYFIIKVYAANVLQDELHSIDTLLG